MPTQTAAERRAEAKAAYDAYLDNCPSRQLLASISDKWVALTISSLGGGPRRYSDLARHMAGISQKMLSQTLKRLERDGLIFRTVTPTVPPRVDYELTKLGRSLHGLVQEIKRWAEEHMEDVLVARAVHDERGPGHRAA